MNTDNRNLGIILVIVGIAVLAARFMGGNIMAYAWPFFIIVPGVFLLLNAHNSRPLNTKQFIGGAVTTATGLLLFFMMISGRWYAWSYAWGIYPVVAGAATVYAARRNNNAELEAQGRQTLRAGTFMLVIFGIFFEVFIFGGLSGAIDWAIMPIVLIGAGIALIAFNRNNGGGGNKPKNDDLEDYYTV